MYIPARAKTSGAYPKTAMDMDLSARKLDKMIEEATVDCYDELEQASGFYTMIEDHLAVPFATQVLGVEVSVVGVEMDDNGSLGLLPTGAGSAAGRSWGRLRHTGAHRTLTANSANVAFHKGLIRKT
jgi:Calcium binding